jgi:hypothetical protein
MPRDTNGNTTPPVGTIVSSGDTVLPSQHNPMVNDVYAMMSQSLSRDGQGGMRSPLDMGTNRIINVRDAVNPNDAVTFSQLQAIIATLTVIPTGSLHIMTGVNAPADYVRANGGSYNRSTLPDLWEWVQTSGNLAATQAAKTHGQYGPGDGSTTFTVPNLEADGGYFIRPQVGNAAMGAVVQDSFKSHTHSGNTNNAGEHTHPLTGFGGSQLIVATGPGLYYGASNTGSAGIHSHPFTTNATGDTETAPKHIRYPVFIKA